MNGRSRLSKHLSHDDKEAAPGCRGSFFFCPPLLGGWGAVFFTTRGDGGEGRKGVYSRDVTRKKYNLKSKVWEKMCITVIPTERNGEKNGCL